MLEASVAVRVAAQFRRPDAQIEPVRDGPGESLVTVYGLVVYNRNRPLYPQKNVLAVVHAPPDESPPPQ